MINRLLIDVSKELYFSEQKTNNLFKYSQLREHQAWKVHQTFLTLIANKLVESMLSEEFSRLPPGEMKAQQIAMRNTKEIIDFLFDPLKGAKNLLRIEAYKKRQEATAKKRP